ncbi:MAG: hypothetical protein ABF456_12610, partial [Lacticaseibacillus paracasei]
GLYGLVVRVLHLNCKLGHSFKSDQTGVTGISLPGNHYRVAIVTPLGRTKYKAYVKKIRDKKFTLKRS